MMVRVKLFRVSKTIVHMIHDMNVQRILNVRKRQDNERQCGSLQSLRGMRSLIKSADTMRNLSLSLVYQGENSCKENSCCTQIYVKSYSAHRDTNGPSNGRHPAKGRMQREK